MVNLRKKFGESVASFISNFDKRKVCLYRALVPLIYLNDGEQSYTHMDSYTLIVLHHTSYTPRAASVTIIVEEIIDVGA